MATASSIDGTGRMIARADESLSPWEDRLNLIAAFAIFLLMVLGTAQIFLRSVFNSPIAGYIDLVELSMASMAFLGAAYCQRLGGHIRMEIFVGSLKGRWLWGFEIFSTLVGLFIIAVLIWFGWDHFMRSFQLGDSTIDAEFPVWPSKLLVPIAFSFWFLRLLIQLMGSIRLIIDPTKDHVGIAEILDPSEQAREEIQETFGGEINNDEVPR